jgi:Cof subfamily protein (haloacid dehalogenase superfamily)
MVYNGITILPIEVLSGIGARVHPAGTWGDRGDIVSDSTPVGDEKNSFARVTPSHVVDEVVGQLTAMIDDGSLKPGDRLPSERRLAEEFGVGRPAIREALRELRAQGAVVTGRGRQGTCVASARGDSSAADRGPSLDPGADGAALSVAEIGSSALQTPHSSDRPAAVGSVKELLELRVAVETQAVALAVRRGSSSEVKVIAEALPAYETLDDDQDRRFHSAIAAASHNPLLEKAVNELVSRLHAQASPGLSVFYEQPHRAAIGGQHAAILAAIRNGDEEGAKRAMARHLDYIGRVLDQALGTLRGIEMIVCDLDGTLLAGPRLVTESTREAIAATKDQDIAVVLASARPPRSMRMYHAMLGLNTPVIAGNGALLWNLDSSIPIAREAIEQDLAREIVDLGRSLGAIVNIESDDEWFSEKTNERVLRNLKVYGLDPPYRVGPVDDLLEEEEPIDKVFLDIRDLPPEARNTTRAAVSGAFGDRANVTETAEGLIDMVSLRASKAVMAQRLARSRGIGADEVAAIGDHDNDVSLLRWAGTGIAMGNATIAAKKAADLVTSSNLRDGVAEAIYAWILPH